MRRRARERQGKRRKKQATDFKAAMCCSSAVVQRAARQKNGLVRGVLMIIGTLEKASSHFVSTQTGSGTAPPR